MSKHSHTDGHPLGLTTLTDPDLEGSERPAIINMP